MILLFLLSLSLLLYAILGEIEAFRLEPIAEKAKCPACTQDVDADWLVCPRCRRLLQMACRGCGAMNFAGWNYCHSCGEEPGRNPHGS